MTKHTSKEEALQMIKVILLYIISNFPLILHIIPQSNIEELNGTIEKVDIVNIIRNNSVMYIYMCTGDTAKEFDRVKSDNCNRL